MLFRERRIDQLEPRRFRDDRVPFTTAFAGGRWATRLAPGGELATDLLIELAGHVGGHVTVVLDDQRGRQRWSRQAAPLGDVRDALVRLRPALARYGGVAVQLGADGDQLTLSPLLVLEISASTDRWRYLLEGQGLVQRDRIPDKAWRKPGTAWPAVPELATAVGDAVARLGLTPAP